MKGGAAMNMRKVDSFSFFGKSFQDNLCQLVLEDRPLTFHKPYGDISNSKLRTLWKNHLFTKRSVEDVRELKTNEYIHFLYPL